MNKTMKNKNKEKLQYFFNTIVAKKDFYNLCLDCMKAGKKEAEDKENHYFSFYYNGKINSIKRFIEDLDHLKDLLKDKEV